MSGFAGKSVIVTGGGSGIGRSAVELLVAKGALVTVAEFDAGNGQEVARAADASGPGKAFFAHTDVGDEQSVRAMVDAAVAAYGRLDGAINAAGLGPKGVKLHEMTYEEWDHVLRVNLHGVFYCTKYEIAAMLKTGGGSIVQIASVAAVMGMPWSAEYNASKAGVTGLVRAAGIEYAQQGIRVNAVSPGATDTPLAHRARARKSETQGGIPIPMGRMADPKEIAAGALWMLSDEASYVTGTCLNIDAGMSIV